MPDTLKRVKLLLKVVEVSGDNGKRFDVSVYNDLGDYVNRFSTREDASLSAVFSRAWAGLPDHPTPS